MKGIVCISKPELRLNVKYMNGKNVLHQLTSQSHSQMMSYVIETADNRIIIIDGGTSHDADYLFSYIKNIRSAAGSDDIHIDAWFLTHAHSDHVDAFMHFYTRRLGEFTVDGIYYNFPPHELAAEYAPGDAHTVSEFNALLPRFADRAHILSKGDVIKVGGAAFAVLYSPDFSIPQNFINNTSLVIMAEIASDKILFLGDLGIEAGNKLLESDRDSLRADFVQMAHHGQNGVTREFYEAVSPKACLWDTPLWLWNNDAGKGYNTHNWQTVIVRGWMDELGIKTYYVTKENTTNVIELPKFH